VERHSLHSKQDAPKTRGAIDWIVALGSQCQTLSYTKAYMAIDQKSRFWNCSEELRRLLGGLPAVIAEIAGN
jgi:hypothetical protein